MIIPKSQSISSNFFCMHCQELTILRFEPGSEEEKVAYVSLYSYLNSRGRCGVAGNPNKKVTTSLLLSAKRACRHARLFLGNCAMKHGLLAPNTQHAFSDNQITLVKNAVERPSSRNSKNMPMFEMIFVY